MRIKLYYNNEIHLSSYLPDSFEEFRNSIPATFSIQLPNPWTLQYIDPDGDKIYMEKSEDYQEFRNLGSQSNNATAKVYIVAVEDVKNGVVKVDNYASIVQKAGNNLEDEDYQVIQNLESRVKNEEELQKNNQKSVAEKVIPEVPIDDKVSEVVFVSEIRGNNEIKEIQQEAEEKKEEFKVQLSSDQKPENLIKDNKSPEMNEIIKKLHSKGIPFAESELFVELDNNKVVEKAITDMIVSEMKSEIRKENEEKKEEKTEQFYLGQPKERETPLRTQENNESLILIEKLKKNVKDVSKTIQSVNRHYNLEASPVDVAPKKEEKRGCIYFKALHKKADKLKESFPKEDYDMLCAYIHDAPVDLTIEELVENYRH